MPIYPIPVGCCLMPTRFSTEWFCSACLVVIYCISPFLAAEDTMLVTGARMERSLTDSAMAATVLTRADIARYTGGDLPELLASVPGLDVRSTGGIGKQTSVFFRGTESDHILVMIDGVRIHSLSSGAIPWEHIPLSEIERIEIVPGPRSALWGSDAIGGVVQIFTRRSSTVFRQSLDFGMGRWGRREGGTHISGSFHSLSLSAGVSYRQLDGFNSRQPLPGTLGVPSYNEPDSDGYDNLSWRWQAGLPLARDGVLQVHGLQGSGRTEYDGQFQNQTDYRQGMWGVRLRLPRYHVWQSELRLTRFLDDGGSYRADMPSPLNNYSRFDTRRVQFAWQNDFVFTPRQALSVGFDYRTERLHSNVSFAHNRRQNRALFLSWHGQFAKHHWQSSLRWDDDRELGTKGTGSLGWTWEWFPSQYLYLNYGTGFKAPSFNELYFPGYGNPDLATEVSRSYESGMRGTHAYGGWTLSVYHTRIQDLIVGFPARNVAKARITGLSAQWRAVYRPWQGELGLDLLDPREPETGQRLIRRAAGKLTLALDWQSGSYQLGAKMRAVAYHYDFDRTRVAGFAVVDLQGRYTVTPRLYMRVRVANVLNKEYQLVRSYNTPDRNFFLSLHYHWGPEERGES